MQQMKWYMSDKQSHAQDWSKRLLEDDSFFFHFTVTRLSFMWNLLEPCSSVFSACFRVCYWVSVGVPCWAWPTAEVENESPCADIQSRTQSRGRPCSWFTLWGINSLKHKPNNKQTHEHNFNFSPSFRSFFSFFLSHHKLYLLCSFLSIIMKYCFCIIWTLIV